MKNEESRGETARGQAIKPRTPMKNDEQEKLPMKVTDIAAVKDNTEAAVMAFNERWVPMPGFGLGVEAMDVRQLRDAMGLRATMDVGDPWPAAEQLLLRLGFRWHWLGAQRVMYMKERDECMRCKDDGWEDAEEWNEE